MAGPLRSGFTSLLLVAGAVFTYWYASPYVSVLALKNAAERGDITQVNARIDYPRLRTSIAEEVAALARPPTPPNAPAAALALSLGGYLVDQVATPENIITLVRRTRVSTGERGMEVRARDALGWEFERENVDRLLVHGRREAETALTAVFERTGFAEWHLVALRAPGLRIPGVTGVKP